jgi:hypothetical protein
VNYLSVILFYLFVFFFICVLFIVLCYIVFVYYAVFVLAIWQLTQTFINPKGIEVN